jgi:glycosyltransferase involved in cell wall biosynthesis
MSCARPVILGVDGHARQILEQADTGIFIQPENPAHLAEAVMRLVVNPALGESLGRNGRQHVLRHFSRRHTASTYLDVLQNLLGEGQRDAAVAA